MYCQSLCDDTWSDSDYFPFVAGFFFKLPQGSRLGAFTLVDQPWADVRSVRMHTCGIESLQKSPQLHYVRRGMKCKMVLRLEIKTLPHKKFNEEGFFWWNSGLTMKSCKDVWGIHFRKKKKILFTCRKLQSVASHRGTKLLHHHNAVFVECPFQQRDDSDTCQEKCVTAGLAHNRTLVSVQGPTDEPTGKQKARRRSPSACVLVCLVVLFAVSQVLVGEKSERQYVLRWLSDDNPCQLKTEQYLVFPAGSTYVVFSSFTHFPAAMSCETERKSTRLRRSVALNTTQWRLITVWAAAILI